jgi:hypothetical protein
MVRQFLFALCALACLASCSKSSGGGPSNPSSPYYFSADLNGSAWVSNVYFSEYKTYPIGVVEDVNGTDYMYILAFKAANGDTSTAFTIVYPTNVPLNTPITLDSVSGKDVVYVSEDPLGSGKFDGYNTATPTGGSGTITITKMDETNLIVEGTFTCTMGSANRSKPAIAVTNGKFSSPFVLDNSQLPPGVKFSKAMPVLTMKNPVLLR